MYNNQLSRLQLITILIFCFLAIAAPITKGQTLWGKIIDAGGSSIPYASIFVKETAQGTTSNAVGEYELTLPHEGSYHLTFQALGFEKQELTVVLQGNKRTVQTVTLKLQAYKLKEVRIYSGNEDPAYAVMRKAIALAPYHLKQVDAYKSEVYLKGTLIMNKIPALLRKQFEVNGNKMEVGRPYSAESINRIEFSRPNKYKHTVTSSRNSFPKADGNNPIGYINASLYEPNFDEIITPFSPQAFSHYKFRYEGFFDEGMLTVNKIKVVPKRKSPQLLAGYIYITEGLWSLHSVDLTNEAFWGKVRIKQVYTPVKDNIWLPATHLFDVEASVMGIKADFSYAGSVKYLSVEANTKLPVPSLVKLPVPADRPLVEPPPTKTRKKIETLMSKENLNNREVAQMVRLMDKDSKTQAPKDTTLEIKNNYQIKVEKDTLKRDTVFWNAIRPIPLTAQEVQSFRIKDSLTLARTAVADTVVNKNKKDKTSISKLSKPILSGHNYLSADSTLRVTSHGLISHKSVGFNPVDGFWIKQSASVQLKLNQTDRLNIDPMLKYSFGLQKVLWGLSLERTYSPMHRGNVILSGGMDTHDFNPYGTTVLVNTVANLFFKENYINLYQRNFGAVHNRIDVANGLVLDAELTYSRYLNLRNHTNYSLIDADKAYAPNVPINANGNITVHLKSQNELSTKVSLAFTPRYRYRIKDGTKIMDSPTWPTFELGWHQGIKALNSGAQFGKVWASVTQHKQLGPFASINYLINGGIFVDNEQMHFSAFQSFGNITAPLETKLLRYNFALIDNYLYSTNSRYAELHASYSTSYLLLKRLPFFSSRIWDENLYVKYLSTPKQNNHIEIGYGLSKIFLAGEVAVVAGFDRFEYRKIGIKASWSF